MTTQVTESGITLNFPDNNYFRFQDCSGYQEIQNNFKEMDLCWYDQANDTLYLIELKNWENNSLEEENDPNILKKDIRKIKNDISNYHVNNLLKKSVDSVCMFMSVLLQKPYSNKIKVCFPFVIKSETKIKLLSIINWTATDNTYISLINTAYKSKFSAYAKLFDIKTFLVMTKDQATKQFDWIN